MAIVVRRRLWGQIPDGYGDDGYGDRYRNSRFFYRLFGTADVRLFFPGLGPRLPGNSVRPSFDSRRLTNSTGPHGRPVRVRRRKAAGPCEAASPE